MSKKCTKQDKVDFTRIRTSITAEELYKKHVKMIYNKAWYFSGRNVDIPFDELVSEGNIIFTKALRRYDSSRGTKFGTLLHTCLHNGMLDFCRNWYNQIPETFDELPETADDSIWCPIRHISLQQHLGKLSSEAQGVVQILLECPDELLSLAKNSRPKHIRGALSRFLVEGLGWRQADVQKTFREIHDLAFSL